MKSVNYRWHYSSLLSLSSQIIYIYSNEREMSFKGEIFGVFHVKNHNFTPKKSYFYQFWQNWKLYKVFLTIFATNIQANDNLVTTHSDCTYAHLTMKFTMMINFNKCRNISSLTNKFQSSGSAQVNRIKLRSNVSSRCVRFDIWWRIRIVWWWIGDFHR